MKSYRENTVNYKKSPVTILDLSKRTVQKILKRANLSCSICGWNQASCDIHHIIPKSKNGTDRMENLIVICPNCHRSIHTHGEKYISTSSLNEKSLNLTFPNWLEYYNPSSPLQYKIIREKHEHMKNFCVCGKQISIDNRFCSATCSGKNKRIFSFTETDVNGWIKDHRSLTSLGNSFGVSANAIRKRMRNMKLYDKYKNKDFRREVAVGCAASVCKTDPSG